MARAFAYTFLSFFLNLLIYIAVRMRPYGFLLHYHSANIFMLLNTVNHI